MDIPKVEKQQVIEALKYIDVHGVPKKNQSRTYDLITEDDKKYPPKYVIAVVRHLVTGEEIKTYDFYPKDAMDILLELGFTITRKRSSRARA